MDQYKQNKIKKSLEIIAQREGLTIDKVREEIAYAVSIALQSNDKDIQQFWENIPHEGPAPTIEEIIDFLAEKIAAQ